ncbi:MAG TPA: hypothetical protein VFU05_15680 [Cyclobacteriaceae bacterium]|nr:hypothetical protein [Cyclobacteriaceae bacterium]
MNTLKSIGAVVAGFLIVGIFSTVTDTILEKAGIFPPPTDGLFVTWMLALALAYRTVYTIAGGYVTAALAPANPSKHVMILGIIGTVMGCIGIYVGFVQFKLSPLWYPVALAVLAYPSVWFGGKLKTR